MAKRRRDVSDDHLLFHPPGDYTTVLAPPGVPVLEVSRIFDARDHLIFEAYTNPAVLPRWFTPSGMDCIKCDVNLQAGGRYRIVNRSRDGVTYGCGGTYLEIRRPHRLVFTESFDVAPGLESRNTLTIHERGGRATVEESVLHQTVSNRDEHAASGVERAIRESHVRLDRLLQSSVLSLDFTIDAPREAVYAACTDLDALSIWSAPPGHEIPFYEAYVRAGGQWRQMIRSPKGGESVVGGRYLEVARDARIAFTHEREPDTDEHSAQTVVAMSLESVGGRTELELEQGFFESRADLERHRNAWVAKLGRLVQLMREFA
jgi:uncharacterized protein YndB with AHSA1/START domain